MTSPPFGWAETEGFIEDDRVREIRRPPRRRADVYRPPRVDIALCYAVLTLHERAPWLLAHRLGLRASTIVQLRWGNLDLTHGYAHVQVKGGHRDRLPIAPDALTVLRDVYRDVAPAHDDYVFTTEVEQEHGNQGRRRVRRDPTIPSKTKALWTMVRRVCARAGVKPFGPHALRHAFATEFLRDSERDVMSLQKLMGHTRLETTRAYVDDLEIEELEDALRRASDRRRGTSPGDATSVADTGDETTGSVQTSPSGGDGPGRNRTSGGPVQAESPGGDRADPPAEPPLTEREEPH